MVILSPLFPVNFCQLPATRLQQVEPFSIFPEGSSYQESTAVRVFQFQGRLHNLPIVPTVHPPP